VSARPAALAPALLALVLPGCGPKPEPIDLALGTHRFRLALPPGWEHLDQGREQVFRRGELRIVFADLGPATPEGVERELEEARETLRQGRRLDAIERVHALRIPAAMYPGGGPREAHWQPWVTLEHAPQEASETELEQALDLLAAQAEALRAPALDTLGLMTWPVIEDDERRALARAETRVLGGREVRVIVTWDRNTHNWPRHHAFLVDRGRLFALSTAAEHDPAVMKAYEVMLGSLEPPGPVEPSPPGGAPGDPAVTSGDQGATGR
jgi:hypothetical protein